jgi:hypothetical protein
MSLSAPLHRRRCDLLSHRIAAVRFTLRNLREDLEDIGSNFDGAPDLEFRMASKALELEQSGLSYQRIPPDYHDVDGAPRPGARRPGAPGRSSRRWRRNPHTYGV